jgi:hypothetical protein
LEREEEIQGAQQHFLNHTENYQKDKCQEDQVYGKMVSCGYWKQTWMFFEIH